MEQRTCIGCGTTFTDRPRSQYCTKQCGWRDRSAKRYATDRESILERQRAQKRRDYIATPRIVRTCIICSGEHYGKGYCEAHWSKYERKAKQRPGDYITGTCVDCGASWRKTRKSNAILCTPCSYKSAGKARTARTQARKPIVLPHVLVCQHCREPFISERQGIKYCGPRCSKESYAVRAGLRHRSCRDCGTGLGYFSTKTLCERCRCKAAKRARIGGNYNRRARHYRVAYEPINRSDVFDADSWVCQLCLLPVEQQVTYPEPKSASLDHIVPMALSGPHLRNNVQLSHLDCNIKKGAIFNRRTLVS